MKLRHFVSASAVVLAGWLAVTFVHRTPSQRYPKLDKYPAASVSSEVAEPPQPLPAGIFPVSVSR